MVGQFVTTREIIADQHFMEIERVLRPVTQFGLELWENERVRWELPEHSHSQLFS